MVSLGKTIAVVLIVICVGMFLCAGYQFGYQYEEGLNFLNNQHSNNTPIVAPAPTEHIPGSSQYGCPGCPGNFMDFAKDMCNGFGSNYTVSDGGNTLKCSEIEGLK